MKSHNIIFFDGYCILCNRAIDKVLTSKNAKDFKFAPLDGPTAELAIGTALTSTLDSIVYWKDEEILTHSNAIIAIAIDMGGWYKLYGVFRIVPRLIRDRIYRHIAKKRYSWFGKNDSCRLPDPWEQEFFLD